MRDIFSRDSMLMKVLGKIFDIGYLSIIFVVFCIPIFTIGASLTALYYTTVKVVRRERGYVFQEFWRSFKLNFGSATILWVIQLVLMLMVSYNLYITMGDGTNKGGFLTGAYIAIALIVYAVSCYAYPVLSRLVLKNSQIVKLSLYMAARHIYFTIPIMIVTLAAIAAMVFFAPIAPLLPILAPAVAALVCSYMMEMVLKKYMPKQEEEVTEDGEVVKHWYNE